MDYVTAPRTYDPSTEVTCGGIGTGIVATSGPDGTVGVHLGLATSRGSSLDPNLPLADVRTPDDVLATSVAEPRLTASLRLGQPVRTFPQAAGIFPNSRPRRRPFRPERSGIPETLPASRLPFS